MDNKNYELALMFEPTSNIGVAEYEYMELCSDDRVCYDYVNESLMEYMKDLDTIIELENEIIKSWRPVEGWDSNQLFNRTHKYDEDYDIELPF